MKASGSYKNLVQGVSQQAPHDRREGQVAEAVNMILDPVNGMSRRHGSKWIAEQDTGFTDAAYAAMLEDTLTWRKFEYTNNGTDYVVLHRTAARPVSSTMPSMIVFNRTTNTFLPVIRPGSDPDLDTFQNGGCSAITSIGRYVFAAGNTLFPAATTSNLWAAAGNQDKAVVWVRGSAYSRTFNVSATLTGGSTVNFSYTTPKSSYSEVLDTSKVPALVADPAGGTEVKTEGAYVQLVVATYQHSLTWGDWNPASLSMKKGTTTMTNVHPAAPTTNMQYAWAPAAKIVTFHSSNLGATDLTISYTVAKTLTNPNYATIVTAMTNAYNSAVTKHIGDSAEAIQPQNIAEQLKLAAIAAGIAGATRQDSTVILPGVKALVTQDGGDGSLIRGVANEVSSADQVSNLHLIGKIVKVRARGSEEAYYLKAVAKNPEVLSGYAEVSWVEAAGESHQITKAFVFGTVSGGNFYLASSPALLTSILAGSHPTFTPSEAGDSTTSPLPFFIGRKITYLGVFQDRLAVGCGGVMRFSRIGDYLNFFRTSALTAPANDALEMLSQGSEDDELRHSVLYDRDLVLFGAKRQYAVSGRNALSPSNANMPVMSSHEGASDIPPIAAGGIIFYSKQGERAPSAHEIRPGQVAESPESYGISTQLVTYFSGRSVEMVTQAKPAMLFLRTTNNRSSIYTFTYLDTDQGRRQDAWSRWDFPTELGPVIGMTGTPQGLLTFTLRSSHNKVWVVADVCPLESGLASYPYMDSIRPWATVATNTGSLRPSTTGAWKVAFDTSTEYQFLGANLADQSTLAAEFPTATGMWAGALQDSFFVMTNPYVKDRFDKAVLTGRLTITKLMVSFNRSSGFDTYITANQVTSIVANSLTSVVSTILESVTPPTNNVNFNGYVFGSVDALLGRVPVTQGKTTVPIGKETTEYTAVVKARTWLPLNVTSIEWVGQFFNNTQRLG
jgi:hypothetical protein